MAFDMAIKFEGGNNAEGESKPFPKQIDVLAWSWGGQSSPAAFAGNVKGTGKAQVDNFSFTKWIDKASPKLEHACLVRTPYDKATLTMRKAGGQQEEYLVIVMEQVIVASFSHGGSGGEDRLTQNLTLNFTKIEVEYKTQDAKGKTVTAGSYAFNAAESM